MLYLLHLYGTKKSVPLGYTLLACLSISSFYISSCMIPWHHGLFLPRSAFLKFQVHDIYMQPSRSSYISILITTISLLHSQHCRAGQEHTRPALYIIQFPLFTQPSLRPVIMLEIPKTTPQTKMPFSAYVHSCYDRFFSPASR